MSKHTITLTVNGVKKTLDVKSNELLLNVLRDRLFLTGAKYGCGIAECGACTILHGDRSVMSCLIPAVVADDWEITTAQLHQPPLAYYRKHDLSAVRPSTCRTGEFRSRRPSRHPHAWRLFVPRLEDDGICRE